MKITKIEIQKKNKNRVNLYLDEEFYCGLSLETIMKNHLKEGFEINQTQIEYFQSETEKEIALSKAVGYISKAQKTKKEIFKYLTSKGFDDIVCQQVLEKLEEYKFVDDNEYAKNYIKFKNKNNGSRKIVLELKQKGIDDEIATQNIQDFSCDRESILNVANKYLKNKDRDLKTKQKAYRHLISRGYNSEDIIFALNNFFKEEE